MRITRAVRKTVGTAVVVFCLTAAAPALAQEAPVVSPLIPEPIALSAENLRGIFVQPTVEPPRQPLFTPRAPRPSELRRPDALMPLYASLVALQGLDIHSTRRALSSGSGREANPAMRGVVKNGAAFLAVKAGATAGVIWASEKMWKKNRKRAVIFAAVVNVAMAAIVANNYRVSR